MPKLIYLVYYVIVTVCIHEKANLSSALKDLEH